MNIELEIIVNQVINNLVNRYKEIELEYEVNDGYCSEDAFLTLHVLSINNIRFLVNTSVPIPTEEDRKYMKEKQLVGILTHSLVYVINSKWLKIIENDEVQY